ncbi:tryptophan 7-halogenase [uncultured Kordia sp.]|uniref:tryptophan 7-halogenase n=1 Tax=uncultured Kordia sp. TaxID=507699 RepID=UPI00260FB3AD|nr:tryptophan 7-halogenase [uncultured Kordia sp.]
MSKFKTDILIIGGGIAGCIAAIALADIYRVTLVDRLAEPKEKIGESLAPAANRILKELDLLNDLEKKNNQVFQQNLGMQSYWGSSQVQIVDHLRNPDGFVKSLDRKAFEIFLRTAAEKRGVTCFWETDFLSSTYETTWKVQLQSGNAKETFQIEADFVIDASGRQSRFARNLGIKREVEDKLIACWISLPNTAVNTMSTISASKNGWWYSAVTPNNKRVIAYHTDADIIEKSELKTTASLLEFAKENNEISALLNGETTTIEFHGIVAANSTKLSQVAGEKWVAIGDAAISFDPLSSQGMFNAMASAMQLRALIQQFGFTDTIQSRYTTQITHIWQHYLKHKSIFYQVEQRWKTTEFWKRRNRDFI